jgi:hypothetical protein
MSVRYMCRDFERCPYWKCDLINNFLCGWRNHKSECSNPQAHARCEQIIEYKCPGEEGCAYKEGNDCVCKVRSGPRSGNCTNKKAQHEMARTEKMAAQG